MMISNFISNFLYSYETTSFSTPFERWDHFQPPDYVDIKGMIQQYSLRRYAFLQLRSFKLGQGTGRKRQKQDQSLALRD